MKNKTLKKICREVEEEYGMSGLSFGLYGDYAKEVAKRYSEIRVKQREVEVLEKVERKVVSLRAKYDARIEGGYAKNSDTDLFLDLDNLVEKLNSLNQNTK